MAKGLEKGKKTNLHPPPKYLKKIFKFYNRKKPDYTLLDKIEHGWNITKDFVVDKLNTVWKIVETVPELPRISDDWRSMVRNGLWIVGLIFVGLIIYLIFK